jgi:hypothetical protein
LHAPSARLAQSCHCLSTAQKPGTVERSHTHTSSALVFGPQIANDGCCWQRQAHRFFTPQHGVRSPPLLKGWLPSTLGASFSFRAPGAVGGRRGCEGEPSRHASAKMQRASGVLGLVSPARLSIAVERQCRRVGRARAISVALRPVARLGGAGCASAFATTLVASSHLSVVAHSPAPSATTASRSLPSRLALTRTRWGLAAH